jgi:dephospho-CoA kinase
MLRVGLTGGIGAGKSTVSAELASSGAVVVDADQLARRVVEPGSPGLAEVVEAFGPGVLRPDGTLDRPALARVAFTDDASRGRLNAILHPRIAELTLRETAAAPPDAVVVHDVPLLTENGLASLYDVVVVVDASPETQLDRLVRLRGMTEEDARARMAAQATREKRLEIADIVIDNHVPLDDLRERVGEVWADLVRRAHASQTPQE